MHNGFGLVLWAAVFLHATVLAQDLELRRIGAWPGFLRQGASAVEVIGHYAYVAAGELHVIDVANPASPLRIGGYKAEGWMRDMVMSGDRAYLSEYSGFEIIDVRNPANPQRLGAYELEPNWTVSNLSVSGRYAYVAQEWYDGQRVKGRLEVIDAGDPSHLRRLGRYEINRQIAALAISGDYAYLTEIWPNPSARDTGRLNVIDVADSAQPKLAGTLDLNDATWRIAISGSIAYLSGSQGLQVIDIGQPSAPRQIGSMEIPGWTGGVVVTNHVAYCIWSGNLRVLDVADPEHPVEISAYAVKSVGGGLAVWDHFCCLGTGMGLEILDLRSPNALQAIGRYDINGDSRDIALSDSYACVADGFAGLHIMDLSRPIAPRCIGGIEIPREASGVAVSGSFAYVVGGDSESSELRIIDISNAAAPVSRAGLETTGRLLDVAVAGDYAYLLGIGWNDQLNRDTGTLYTVDVRNPDIPRFAGRYDFDSQDGYNPRYGSGVVVSGAHAYVAAQLYDESGFSGGLLLLNVADPAGPKLEGMWRTSDGIADFAIAGNYAFVTGGAGLQIVDISQPANPRRVGRVGKEWCRAVAVSDRYAYFNSAGSVLAVDIRDPANAQVMGRREPETLSYGPTQIVASDRYLWTITSGYNLLGGWIASEGIAVFEAIPRAKLRLVRAAFSPGGPVSLTVSGASGQRVHLQRSANLMDWEEWQTITLGESPVEILDEVSARQGFYRAVEESSSR